MCGHVYVFAFALWLYEEGTIETFSDLCLLCKLAYLFIQLDNLFAATKQPDERQWHSLRSDNASLDTTDALTKVNSCVIYLGLLLVE